MEPQGKGQPVRSTAALFDPNAKTTNRSLKSMRWLPPLLMTLAAFVFFPTTTHAAPRTKRGVCGSVLPTSARSIGKNRYSVRYRSMYSLRKFYRKVFGRRNPKIRVIKLLALPKVLVYHIKNLRSGSSWKGMNLTLYRRKGKISIYVICRN